MAPRVGKAENQQGDDDLRQVPPPPPPPSPPPHRYGEEDRDEYGHSDSDDDDDEGSFTDSDSDSNVSEGGLGSLSDDDDGEYTSGEYTSDDDEYGTSSDEYETDDDGEEEDYGEDDDNGDNDGGRGGTKKETTTTTSTSAGGWWPFSRSRSDSRREKELKDDDDEDEGASPEAGPEIETETSAAAAKDHDAAPPGTTVKAKEDDGGNANAIAENGYQDVDGDEEVRAKDAASSKSTGNGGGEQLQQQRQQQRQQRMEAPISFEHQSVEKEQESRDLMKNGMDEDEGGHIAGSQQQQQQQQDQEDYESYDEEGSYGDADHEHAAADDDDDDDDEQGQPSLSERRSLLSLASEHDRVDIINALVSGDDMLSSTGTSTAAARQPGQADPALVDLLLNNRPQHDAIFIPPLHVAISSGSTRAVAALLRLGSDPSIRPDVPRGYIPPWVESAGSGAGNASVGNWRKFDGMSAWELAYGRSEELVADDGGDGNGSDGDESDDEVAQPARRARSWFFGGSSSTMGAAAASDAQSDKTATGKAAKTDANKRRRRKRSPLNIAPSKLEGIRHAFTAEALRCIGSDEVDRLNQLVNAGMDKSVEVGGKNLLVWALEMAAIECVKMLTERWGAVEEETLGDYSNGMPEDAAANSTHALPPTVASQSAKVPAPPSPQSVDALRRALEESESLTPALSSMLDNLAEEVSISQGLLLTESGSKASLVGHVRSLKANKAEREEELVFWSGKLEDREWELDDRLRRISMLGGTEERSRVWRTVEERVHVKEIEEQKKSQQDLTVDTRVADEGAESQGHVDDVNLKAALQAELAASQTKLSQLRASIADLAEENDRNLAEVQNRGLAGAVKLARNLREELRTVEDDLRVVRSAEAGLRVRVGLVSAELERMEAEKDAAARAKAEAVAAALREKQTGAGRLTPSAESTMISKIEDSDIPEESEPIGNEEADLVSDDEEFQQYVAEQHGIKEEEEELRGIADGDGSEEDGVLVQVPAAEDGDLRPGKKEPASDSIKAGHSTAIIVRPGESGSFLPAGIWELLKRIVGFGRAAAQESAEEVADEFRQSIADVMIV